jgi:predicted alpha-1,2-mannosidase
VELLNYVNIKQGTDSDKGFSNGNTLPLTQVPFAMAAFAPQTSSTRGNWYYNPRDRFIEGIRLTHQPSPWIGDYGHICFMPQEGNAVSSPNLRRSGFRPAEATLQPHYMKIKFLRYNADFELTPTLRGAAMRMTYYGDKQARFNVMGVKDYCSYELDENRNMLTGYTKAHSWEVASNFCMYFAIRFDSDLDIKNCFLMSDSNEKAAILKGEGNKHSYSVAFEMGKKVVNAFIATSYISIEQAKENFKQELSQKDFDILKEDNEKLWESYLSKIEIESKLEERMKTFYSCLYRMFLYPHMFHEITADGKTIHYCPHDGSIAEGVMYTDNGFWDTFRTVYPLFSLIIPEKLEEMIEGFINIYRDCGWLPKWPSPGEVGMMPGTLIDAVIAHAAVTNSASRPILEKALEGMIKHATVVSNESCYGRSGIGSYKKYGYIPRDLYRESVNHTLDYAYGDFCIAQTAKVLGKKDILAEYSKSSENYRIFLILKRDLCVQETHMAE